MSIRPEKLKQYIALKEAALRLRPEVSVACNDPNPDSRNATVSILLHTPHIAAGKTRIALAALYTLADTVYTAGSRIPTDDPVVRLTFAAEGLQDSSNSGCRKD